MHKFILLSAILALLITGSCVSTKQYQEMQENFRKCQEETDILKGENQDLTIQSTEMASQIGVLKVELGRLMADSISKTEELKQIQTNLNKVDRQYKDLQIAQEELLKGNMEETKKLLKELQLAQEDMQIREDQAKAMQEELSKEKDRIEALRIEMEERNKQLTEELEERNQRMVELERILFTKDSVMNALKNKISTALTGFENNGLTVTRKEGKIYVSLEEKLLFASGSAEIGAEGVSAIKKLAKVLEENKDINVMIEGHTDDLDYIPDAAIKDNWDLSVKRANTIVRIILKNSNIDPKRLTSAGRSEYMPLDPTKTPEARRKNRRTEIILTPKLDELFEILDNTK